MNTVHTSHPLFDIESAIVANRNQPSPVDLKPWQNRIDSIVGKTPDGKSRLRIVGGQHGTTFSCGKTRRKYPFWRYEDAGEIVDIGIPRFYVEELHTNSELHHKDAWDNARYYYDEATRELIDVLGPVPQDGFYSALF